MSAAKIMNLFSQFIETELEQEIDTGSSEWKALAKNVSKLLGKKDSKKKKDPNAPKKPSGPWIQYCNEHRKMCKEQMEEKGESATPREVLKELGRKWKEFQATWPEKVEEYKKKYEEDKKKHEEAKKKYAEENHDSESENSDSVPQKKKKIKRGKNAWQMFCAEKRPELAGEFGPKEIMTKLSEMWKEVKEEGGDEYQKYVDMSNAEKERIKKEQAEEEQEEVEEEEVEEEEQEEVEEEEVEEEEQEEVEEEEVEEEEQEEVEEEEVEEEEQEEVDEEEEVEEEITKEKMMEDSVFKKYFNKLEKKTKKKHPEYDDDEVFEYIYSRFQKKQNK